MNHMCLNLKLFNIGRKRTWEMYCSSSLYYIIDQNHINWEDLQYSRKPNPGISATKANPTRGPGGRDTNVVKEAKYQGDPTLSSTVSPKPNEPTGLSRLSFKVDMFGCEFFGENPNSLGCHSRLVEKWIWIQCT